MDKKAFELFWGKSSLRPASWSKVAIPRFPDNIQEPYGKAVNNLHDSFRNARSGDIAGSAKNLMYGLGNTALAGNNTFNAALNAFVVDPLNAASKDSYDSYNNARAGDWAGAGTKAVSSLGNTLLTVASLFPAVGMSGRALAGGLQGAARGAKLFGLANAGNKLTSTGNAVSKASTALKEMHAASPLGVITGGRNALPYAANKSIPSFLGNVGRGAVNFTVPSASTMGLSALGDYAYDQTPGAKMEQIQDYLPEYLGDQTAKEISRLSRQDKIKMFDQLNQIGIPESIFTRMSEPAQ